MLQGTRGIHVVPNGDKDEKQNMADRRDRRYYIDHYNSIDFRYERDNQYASCHIRHNICVHRSKDSNHDAFGR